MVEEGVYVGKLLAVVPEKGKGKLRKKSGMCFIYLR